MVEKSQGVVTAGMKRAGGRILEDAFDVSSSHGEDLAEEIFMAMVAIAQSSPVELSRFFATVAESKPNENVIDKSS